MQRKDLIRFAFLEMKLKFTFESDWRVQREGRQQPETSAAIKARWVKV